MAINLVTNTFTGTNTGDSQHLAPNDRVASTFVFQIVLTSTGTVAINGTVDGISGNIVALLATNLHDGTTTNSITASGLYRVDATGLSGVWATVSANGAGVVVTTNRVDG